MPFDAEEKERIRYHLGYLQTQPAASITFGVPRPIQTLFLVESAMDLVLAEGEDRVRRLVQILDGIECKLVEAQDYMAVDQLDGITIRKEHADHLENEYLRWASRLADVLGVPLYPYADRFIRARSRAGGIVPVRS